ncbi:BQ5605_C010g06162 [Microbotryum silenes-dioicae]|uniref:BQ5605_C010g06162 protein n=1 Tax=Microbotryum silenes-dioicae TaxID=796604 RepID=A0A2X0MBV6_9BASI|nr:BQ5605_C010g06162 [Microbotryum silenes-dioicae]
MSASPLATTKPKHFPSPSPAASTSSPATTTSTLTTTTTKPNSRWLATDYAFSLFSRLIHVTKDNVFSNDGSFLTRFKKVDPIQGATEEKKRVQQQLLRKKAADERFKNRGKRPLITPTSATTNSTTDPATHDTSSTKKAKTSSNPDEQDRSEYQKEVDRLKRAGGLRDEGYAVRPVLK